MNTIDIRGLFDSSMIEARDAVSTLGDANATAAIVERRRRDVSNTQDGLSFIAAETGGKFYKNENYLDAPIGRALAKRAGERFGSMAEFTAALPPRPPRQA